MGNRISLEANLYELEVQFSQAKTVEALSAILQKYLLNLGVTMFAFTYYSYYPNSLNKLKYDFSSPAFAPWHKHYIEENYEEIDSTLETVYKTSLPTFFTLEKQLEQATTPKEKQMRLDSMAFGAEQGICFPIHGPQEDFACLVLVQMRGQTCLVDWKKKQYELFLVGYYYYSYLQSHLLKTQEPVEKYNLNKRDIQCLVLIAKHYSPADMAKSLNITERTVNYHIQRLNKKLGTKNKHQSVAKALQKGLLKL